MAQKRKEAVGFELDPDDDDDAADPDPAVDIGRIHMIIMYSYRTPTLNWGFACRTYEQISYDEIWLSTGSQCKLQSSVYSNVWPLTGSKESRGMSEIAELGLIGIDQAILHSIDKCGE